MRKLFQLLRDQKGLAAIEVMTFAIGLMMVLAVIGILISVKQGNVNEAQIKMASSDPSALQIDDVTAAYSAPFGTDATVTRISYRNPQDEHDARRAILCVTDPASEDARAFWTGTHAEKFVGVREGYVVNILSIELGAEENRPVKAVCEDATASAGSATSRHVPPDDAFAQIAYPPDFLIPRK